MLWALLLFAQLLTAKVSPTVCMTPCNVTVEARVEPHPDNRWLVVQINGPTMNGSSTQLNGDTAALYHMTQFKDLPQGDYVVVAVLYQLKGEVARKTFRLQVR